MSQIVLIEVEGGGSFYAQVSDHEGADTAHIADTAVTSGSPEQVLQQEEEDVLPPPGGLTFRKVEVTSQQIQDAVKAATDYVRNAFTEFNRPSELTLEFSIAFKAGGAIPVLVEASTDATFKVSAKWVNPPVATSGPGGTPGAAEAESGGGQGAAAAPATEEGNEGDGGMPVTDKKVTEPSPSG